MSQKTDRKPSMTLRNIQTAAHDPKNIQKAAHYPKNIQKAAHDPTNIQKAAHDPKTFRKPHMTPQTFSGFSHTIRVRKLVRDVYSSRKTVHL